MEPTDSNTLTIEQVLFDSVLYAEIREARAGTQVTLAQLEQSRLDSVQGIIEDYIATLKQAETVALLDQEITSVRQSLKLAWSRFWTVQCARPKPAGRRASAQRGQSARGRAVRVSIAIGFAGANWVNPPIR